jgi:rRNA maturation RNase YbeY
MQKIDIQVDSQYTSLFDQEKARLLILQTLQAFKINDFLLELDIVSSDAIRIINKEHRKIDKPTDVLSFPQIEIPGQKYNFLGSLVISPEMVQEKNEEMDDVIKHGILHLLGFDHEGDETKWGNAAKIIKCQL